MSVVQLEYRNSPLRSLNSWARSCRMSATSGAPKEAERTSGLLPSVFIDTRGSEAETSISWREFLYRPSSRAIACSAQPCHSVNSDSSINGCVEATASLVAISSLPCDPKLHSSADRTLLSCQE